jgi:histidinol-phosphatase (PHP family)
MKQIKTNYHTHCDLCNHAKGTIEDYVIQAIENGFTAIGISDHAPLDFLEERSVRMPMSMYPEYKRQLKHAIVHYLDYILIYRSLEIEYFEHLDTHYQSLLEELDYLILGQHYIQINDQMISTYRLKSLEELKTYTKTVIKAMRTGYFKILAHPEIFLLHQPNFTEEINEMCKSIILTAKETNTLLEMNANGFRKKLQVSEGKSYRIYPRTEFWQIVKDLNAKTIISADAHDPKQLMDDAMVQTYEFARHLSIAVEEELVLD